MAYRSHSTVDQAVSSTITFTLPAGTVDGDLLLMTIVLSGATGTLDAKTGWTHSAKRNVPFGTGNTNRWYSSWHYASGEASTIAFTLSSAVGSWGGFMVAYDTPDGSPTPSFEAQVEGRVTDGSGASAVIGTLADPNSFNETIVYIGFGQGVSAYTGTTPDGSTNERIDQAFASGPANRIFMYLADEEFTAAANYPARTIGPATWTGTTQEGIAIVRTTNVKVPSSGNDGWGWGDGQERWQAA